MPVEEITITSQQGDMTAARGTIDVRDMLGSVVSAGNYGAVEVHIVTPWRRTYLSADEDPVLADLWDNDDDAIYDSM